MLNSSFNDNNPHFYSSYRTPTIILLGKFGEGELSITTLKFNQQCINLEDFIFLL